MGQMYLIRQLREQLHGMEHRYVIPQLREQLHGMEYRYVILQLREQLHGVGETDTSYHSCENSCTAWSTGMSF